MPSLAVRRLLPLLAAAPLTWGVRAAWGLPASLGASQRAVRPFAAGSPRYRDGHFANSLPGSVMAPGSQPSLLRALLTRDDRGKPGGVVPLRIPEVPETPADLAVTWYGHASALLELDGQRVLVDPIWGERASPSPLIGPRRLHPVPVALNALPQVDAVLISHDHYDHLDRPTVRTLLRTQTAPFVVPLGVGAHLRRWNVPEQRIVELDWDTGRDLGGLRITCTEARHFSGRLFTRNPTLWASWALTGPRHRIFFGGDSGYTPAFVGIGAEHGPFDLTLLPIGAYGPQWPDIHMNPEEALVAHRDLRGDVLLPIHWATFDLAFHAWAEPADRLCAAAHDAGVRLVIPRPGERIEPPGSTAPQDWWTAAA